VAARPCLWTGSEDRVGRMCHGYDFSEIRNGTCLDPVAPGRSMERTADLAQFAGMNAEVFDLVVPGIEIGRRDILAAADVLLDMNSSVLDLVVPEMEIYLRDILAFADMYRCENDSLEAPGKSGT